ncbi:MAG: hypothetical protein OEU54_02195 [Gemmatimonadota bacterium]|nr:hypothetical protein [Gemmatimonadota bacterium]
MTSDPTKLPEHPKTLTTVIAMTVALLVPAILTLMNVDAPSTTPPSQNPTPFGYTISLLLFAMPVAVIGIWFFLHPRQHVDRKAMLCAALAVFILGSILDFGFGYSFFVFPNPDATLGWRLPAWSWGQMAWVGDYLPIEEFGFYIFGAFFMITTYIWADTDWLKVYDHEQRGILALHHRKIINFSPWPIVIAVALIAVAYFFKKSLPAPHNAGFPAYFTFLCLLAFVPASVLIGSVGKFINWRAFVFAYAVLLLVSLVWEATLGVPYNWWNYQGEQMIGIRITAWAELPVEAVLLWLAAAFGAVGAYETFRMYFHLDRPFWQALFGPGPEDE